MQHLKPRYVLMLNVVDLCKFANSFLGCYALGRLFGMYNQVRMWMMAVAAYGLHQFCMCVFLFFEGGGGDSLLRFVNNNNYFIWFNYLEAFLC